MDRNSNQTVYPDKDLSDTVLLQDYPSLHNVMHKPLKIRLINREYQGAAESPES
jgi:hypothetical protein